MKKSFTIINPEITKQNIFGSHIPIEYESYISLVESCSWLTWDELTEFGMDYHAKRPTLPKKRIALMNLDRDKYIEVSFQYNWVTVWFHQKILYKELRLIYEFAKSLHCNLWDRDTLEQIDDSYLEALRIKEENRGIKLTKEQSHVLESIEDQCRWWYLPTEDLTKIFNILGIQPNIKDGDITIIIDDVQRENKVTIATFTGHTIIFGFNAPYISYPDLQTYITKEEQQTPHLQDVLNKLSKAFGTAAYFEYNNDDEQIASLAWSSKGKFVYGRFTSEGEGFDVFGTQKKTIEVNQKSIIKTAKKLGMTPEDIITGMMKQKMQVRYFEQHHWYIESRLSRRH
jgi:hypothetical protein